MSDAYVGEIRLFGGKFAPAGWHFCDGSLLPINNNQALYSLIGSAYGGNGVNTFALPDFRGRVGISQGQSPGLSPYLLAENGGELAVTLTEATTPNHSHSINTAGTGASTATAGPTVTFANATGENVMYVNAAAASPNKVSPAPTTVGAIGSGQHHENLMPCLAVNYIICLNGTYPNFQ